MELKINSIDNDFTLLFFSADCGGPFELWEPNTTFTSMNFPDNYPNQAFCESFLFYNMRNNCMYQGFPSTQ